jgi:putative ABC transport system permease protein
MINNYIKSVWRNLVRNKFYSFINIFGLSVGFTCCILITIFINNEYSYDAFHRNSDRIYNLEQTMTRGEKEDHFASISAPIAILMQQEFPVIEKSVRFSKLFLDDKTLLQYSEPSGNTKSFYETKGYLADPSFFNVFTYDFKEGNSANALIAPNSLVISEEIAEKFFGMEPALNKIIHISSSTNGDHDYKITGVFRNHLFPSHIDARFLLSFKGGNMDELANGNASIIGNNMFYTYFLLQEGANPANLQSQFPAFIEKHMGKELRTIGLRREFSLTALKDIHLRSGIENTVTPEGNVSSLFILGSIAILTLVIACINFMNLSTSSSSKRAVEIGVRKVLGAQKSSLLWQFLGEAVLMALIAFFFAINFTLLLLPLFEKISGKNLYVSNEQRIMFFIGFFFLTIITGLFAGSYPAFYLSSFKPVRVLKGKFMNSLAAVSLRKGMVIFQFVISVVLIVASIVIADQMKFIRSKDLGFIKEHQIVLPLRSSTAKNLYGSLKKELAGQSDIQSVGASQYYPGIINTTDWLLYKEGQTMNESKRVFINRVDHSLLQTLDIQGVAGRLFSEDFPADTNDRIILNETAARELGFLPASQAVGKWVALDWEGTQHRLDVIGIVKDFHFKDLHIPIEPYGFLLGVKNNYNYLIAHSKSGNTGNTLTSLKNVWHKINPGEPFEYSLLDQDFQKNYEADNRLASLINYFTLIAILISCLGLFGLSIFSAEQRIKEIGIRKVLGASISNIVFMLSKDFLKLVCVAVLIASPIAWFAMNKWLQNFAYRITISWDVFVLTIFLAIFIALVTIIFQAVKAAMSNPVKNLRTE